MKRWKKHRHLVPRFNCEFNGRNHVAVCRNNNTNITFFLINIIHYLSRDSHICLFFLKCLDSVATIITFNFFFKIFSKYQFKFRILGIGLKKSILVSTFFQNYQVLPKSISQQQALYLFE